MAFLEGEKYIYMYSYTIYNYNFKFHFLKVIYVDNLKPSKV